MKGLFIPEITAEMFRNGCLEGIEALMAEGEIYDIDYTGWIPCSERLPEPRMAVLGYAPRYQNIYALYYDTVLGWMVWSPIRDDCFPNSQGEIVAWMPLPEPYKGEE